MVSDKYIAKILRRLTPHNIDLFDTIQLCKKDKLSPEEAKNYNPNPEETLFNSIGHPKPSSPSNDLSGKIHILNTFGSLEYLESVMLTKYQIYFKSDAEKFLENNDKDAPLYKMVKTLYNAMFDEDQKLKLWSNTNNAKEFFQKYQTLSKSYWLRKTAKAIAERRRQERALKMENPDRITEISIFT